MYAESKGDGESNDNWPRWMKSIGQPIVRTFYPWNLTYNYVVIPNGKEVDSKSY